MITHYAYVRLYINAMVSILILMLENTDYYIAVFDFFRLHKTCYISSDAVYTMYGTACMQMCVRWCA
jgi:hypothetical protein